MMVSNSCARVIAVSMGQAFRDGLCESAHRIGLDRPAISAPHRMAVFGWHNQRDSVPPSLNAGRAGGGLFLFHVLTLPVVAVDRIPSLMGVGLRKQVGKQFEGEVVDVSGHVGHSVDGVTESSFFARSLSLQTVPNFL